MKIGNVLIGILMIFLGIVFLLNSFFDFRLLSINTLWPLFILIPGILFEFSFFAGGRNPGLLVPGGILTTIGMLFLFETLTDWNFSAFTWPVYPLAVAIGLWQLYLFSDRNKALLIPVTILGGFSLVSFLAMIFRNLITWSSFSIIIAIVFILMGVYILLGNGKKV